MPLLWVMMMTGGERNRNVLTSPDAVTLPTVSSTDPVNAATEVILVIAIVVMLVRIFKGRKPV